MLHSPRTTQYFPSGCIVGTFAPFLERGEVNVGDQEKKLLPRCGGRLSAKEAARGMNAAAKNARRLLEDAKLLLAAGRYPTAVSLSILAIEEAGKLSIIRSILSAANEKELKGAWKRYRSHRAKNATWIMPLLAARGARTLWGFREVGNDDAEHTEILDALKQLGFYTDFVGERNWSEPEAVIDAELAAAIYSVGMVMANEREITEEEVALWMVHLGPDSEHGLSQQGLARYFLECVEKGILDHEPEDIMKFLFGGANLVESDNLPTG